MFLLWEIFFLFFITSRGQIFKNVHHSISLKLIDSLERISNSFETEVVLIIYQRKNESNFPDIVAQAFGSRHLIQVSNADYKKPDWFRLMFRMEVGKAESIFIILENSFSPEKGLLVSREQALWNSQAKIIFLIKCAINCSEVSEIILRLTWRLTKSLNVLVISVGETNRYFLSYPYEGCMILHSTEINSSEEEMFPEKIPSDFTGCEFNVATVAKEPYVLPPTKKLDYQEVRSLKLNTASFL